MDIGILIIWLCLVVYILISLKAEDIVKKKERKWVCMLVIVTLVCTILSVLHISFHEALSVLDDIFGNISRMVVKK